MIFAGTCTQDTKHFPTGSKIVPSVVWVICRAAIRLKILIAINRAFKIFNRD